MAAPAEIAASLTMEDIPVKLRCATCNKLAIDAFRMPCCDQSICAECQASLPEACPVCFHEPVIAGDCRPNKALRTTIKVFLRKKVMERDAVEKKKRAAEKAAATPATPAAEETPARQPSPTPILVRPEATITNVGENKPTSPAASLAPETPNDPPKATELSTPTEAQKDVPQASIESPGPDVARRASTQTAGDGSVGQEKGVDNEKQSEQQLAASQNQQWLTNNGFEQGMNNGAFEFDGTNGGFPNMGLNGMGDFSQMMQFMPNGMPNNMMGSMPNMMGMPGMNMDPMAMSQMYGGFGGQGMGMNNMNMGVGFDAGQGAFGGFNGQPTAWNAGQNKFNANAYGNHAGMGAMGGGDYGANAGYGGYNVPQHQGNYNQMHQHQYPNNDFHQGHHSQGFQSRGRGRGRGYLNAGRGRGGYNQYNQYNQTQGNGQANGEAFHQQLPEVTRRGSPSYGPLSDQPEQPTKVENQEDAKAEQNTNQLTAEEQLSKELDPGDADDNDETASKDPPPDQEPKDGALQEESKDEAPKKVIDSSESEAKTSDPPPAEPAPKEEIEKPAPIQTYISDEPTKPDVSIAASDPPVTSSMLPPPSPMIPTGPAAFHAEPSMDTSPRGRGIGRGYTRGSDYRNGSHGRAPGYVPNGNMSHAQPAPVARIPPVAIKGLGVEGAPKGPKALREGLPNTGVRGFSIVGRASAAAQARPPSNVVTKSPSRERSRSPTRHQSSHHRHHRHRSTSPSSSTEREKRRDRHHRHSRRHEDDEDDDRHEAKGSRIRDASVDSSSRRSSHRSRRHYDEEKSKDVERSSHRSHRSHRDRSKDGEREERSSKKREKTPELIINGASRSNGITKNPTSNRHRDHNEEDSARSSRKRRSDDDEDYRDQKRKRRDDKAELEEREQEKENERSTNHRSSRPSKRDSASRVNDEVRKPNPDRPPPPQEKPAPKEIPKGPKQDNNILSERDKYAAERIARENQRRMSQIGSGTKGAAGGKGTPAGRRVSHHKYEDDETISRGENEREALRYR